MRQRRPKIISDTRILGGKPILDGTRLSVEFILELIQSGLSFEEILSEYPQLTPSDLRVVFDFAKDAVGREKLYLSHGKTTTV